MQKVATEENLADMLTKVLPMSGKDFNGKQEDRCLIHRAKVENCERWRIVKVPQSLDHVCAELETLEVEY